MLIKWHETFLGLINARQLPRKVSWDENIRQGRFSCQDQLASAARYDGRSAFLCDARTRVALTVRASATPEAGENARKGRQCHSCQDPFSADTSERGLRKGRHQESYHRAPFCRRRRNDCCRYPVGGISQPGQVMPAGALPSLGLPEKCQERVGHAAPPRRQSRSTTQPSS